jgi:hypothetical protein
MRPAYQRETEICRAIAAPAYWSAWRTLQISFPRKDQSRVPTHWRVAIFKWSREPNYPRILTTPIDSKKAFIKLAKPWARPGLGRTRTTAWSAIMGTPPSGVSPLVISVCRAGCLGQAVVSLTRGRIASYRRHAERHLRPQTQGRQLVTLELHACAPVSVRVISIAVPFPLPSLKLFVSTECTVSNDDLTCASLQALWPSLPCSGDWKIESANCALGLFWLAMPSSYTKFANN